MGKYANFYDGVRKLLDKIADALDPGAADTKTANYQTAVLNSLSRIGDNVGDVVSATLPDASTATDGDTLVVDDGEWTIGSGGGGGGVLIVNTTVGDSTITMDKTYAEIKSAFMNGLVICIQSAYGGHSMALVTFVYDDEEECDVDVFDAKNNNTFEFTCSSVNDYPNTTIG